MQIKALLDTYGSGLRVLVFGAHGDDEIIGCGATIAMLSATYGCKVSVVTFTRRETSYARVEDREGAAIAANREMAAANDILGVQGREVLGIPNQGVVNERETFQRVVKLIRQFQPHIIITHNYQDRHRDHRAVHDIVTEARWKAWENLSPDWGAPWETEVVLLYEIMGDLFAKPDLIVTFPPEMLDRKLAAMRTQVSQLEVLRGIEQQLVSIARSRGGLIGGEGCVGEAFVVSDFHPTHVRL